MTDIVTSAVHATMFDVLCVLDGVIAIESSPKKSQLELNAVKDNRQTRLNDPREDVHDIYQALVWEEVFGEHVHPQENRRIERRVRSDKETKR